jgi:hypothetical protein
MLKRILKATALNSKDKAILLIGFIFWDVLLCRPVDKRFGGGHRFRS